MFLKKRRSNQPKKEPGIPTAQAGPVFNGPSKRRFLGIAAVVLVVLAGAVIAYTQLIQPNDKIKTVGNDSALQQAIAYLDGSNQTALKDLVGQIAAAKEVDKSPDSLYVLTTYYTYESEVETARNYLNKLKDATAKTPVSQELVQKSGDIDAAEKRLVQFEAQKKQFEANFRGFGDDGKQSQ